jgi:hypothetical protein
MRLKRSNAAARVCVLVSFCVLVATAVMAVPAHAALPEARVYEMVSPPDKGPFGAGKPVVGAGGERIAFYGSGAFAGSPAGLTLGTGYLASRSSLGWQTSPLAPPAALSPLVGLDEPNDFSPDLGLSTSVLDFAPEHSVSQSSQVVFLHSSDAPDVVENFTPLSPPITTLTENSVVFYEGASADFGRLVYSSKQALIGSDPTAGGVPRLYESTSSSPSSLKLVAVDDSGKVLSTSCEVWQGSHGTTKFHAVSADEVFFEVCGALYVRVNGSKTVQISGSALFQGASSDGSKVFFTEGASLYEDEIEAGAVTRKVLISDATVGVTRISEDGSHVYFVSNQRIPGLLNGLEPKQEAVAGAENLYMYNTLTPETKFVAELCGGKETSGSVTGVRQCPGSESDQRLWQAEDERPVQTSGCFEGAATCESGRYLAFDTYAQLIGSGPEVDKDTALDVYRYDALTGRIRRVSVGVEGHDHNGNNDAFDATIATPRFGENSVNAQYELESRAISENGTVVFTTAEPLSVDAVNGLQNVYVWHEEDGRGSAGMISSGSSVTSDEHPVIDVSGRDVFFQTTAGLVPQDTDGLPDVYDARIEGGFPAAPVQAGGCSGAACQGPPSVPALLAPPASATFSGLGNPAPPSANPAVKKVVVKPLTDAQKLASALRACRKKPKSQRKRCESQAHKRYAKKASKSGRRA